MKGGAVETRVRKYGGKKKAGKIETRSDREKKGGRERVWKKEGGAVGGVCVWASLSQQGAD